MIDLLISSQCDSGAFQSIIHRPQGRQPDENCFFTALIVHALKHVGDNPDLVRLIDRALGFLESCVSPDGLTFGYYAPGSAPDWIGELPPDVDDTALAAMALYEHGRLRVDDLHRIVEACDPFRLHYRSESEWSWVSRGAYRTWLSDRIYVNPVDCCVNTNMATLLAAAGRRGDPAFDAALSTVTGGINWSTDYPDHVKRLTPYYPGPQELANALRRGCAGGLQEFQQCWGKISEFNARHGHSAATAETPICCSIDCAITWTCPALFCARRLVLRTDDPTPEFEGKSHDCCAETL